MKLSSEHVATVEEYTPVALNIVFETKEEFDVYYNLFNTPMICDALAIYGDRSTTDNIRKVMRNKVTHNTGEIYGDFEKRFDLLLSSYAK